MAEDIKQALEYAVGLEREKVEIHEIEGRTYSTHKLNLIQTPKPWEETTPPKPVTLKIRTLQGLVDYIKENREGINFGETMLMVNDFDNVCLLSTPGENAKRTVYIEAGADVPRVSFAEFMEVDKFIVYLMSLFQPSEDRSRVIQYVTHIVDDQTTTVSDDGITQKVIVKAGVSGRAEVDLPNPVRLAPYRTFPELEQPISEFIFRLNDKGQCALFEADGGNWRNQCREIIKDCLKDELKDIPGIIVIG